VRRLAGLARAVYGPRTAWRHVAIDVAGDLALTFAAVFMVMSLLGWGMLPTIGAVWLFWVIVAMTGRFRHWPRLPGRKRRP
jgi:hypothetical protein